MISLSHLGPIALTILNLKQRLTPIPNAALNLYLIST